jgi:phage tail sheath protein FI
MVFEPNNSSLRAELRALLTGFLRSLGALGAFRGATEEESFFVRCDATNNSPADIDAGRVIAEIGVAPSEPIEFIVLRFSRNADGTFTAEK